MICHNWSNILLGLVAFVLMTQNVKAALWNPMPSRKGRAMEEVNYTHPQLRVLNTLSMQLNTSALNFDTNEVDGSILLDIPFPDGKVISFKLFASDVLPAELSAKYPQIKVFSGPSVGVDEELYAEVDYSPAKGFHAKISGHGKGQDIYVDPFDLDIHEYKVFTNDEIQQEARKLIDKSSSSCGNSDFDHLEAELHDHLEAELHDTMRDLQRRRQMTISNDDQWIFRIAIVTSGEYSLYHGNNVDDVLSAIVTAMTRVNGIFKRSVGVSFELHPRADELICLYPCPQLSNSRELIKQVVPFLTHLGIPFNSYDIAHAFTTAEEGYALPFSVCDKGAGMSGASDPIGDSFFVDFIAHEIGHQFGASHTFSECSIGGINDNPLEPGSGSTIMAYAGGCDEYNIQTRTDSVFHSFSVNMMQYYIQKHLSTKVPSCGRKLQTKSRVPTGKVAPTCQVPHSTFFRIGIDPLTIDPNATYSIERFSVTPGNKIGQYFNRSWPRFRSWLPSKRPYRMFPNLFYIINGATDKILDEIVPQKYSTIIFRAMARSSFSTLQLYDDVSKTTGFGGTFSSDILVEFGSIESAPLRILPRTKFQAWKANSSLFFEWTGGKRDANLSVAIAKHDERFDWNQFDIGFDALDYDRQILELDWKKIGSVKSGSPNDRNIQEIVVPYIYDQESLVHVMLYSDGYSGCAYFDVLTYVQYEL